MLTLLEIVKRAEIFLREKGIKSARREAEDVIADKLGMKRIELYLHFDQPFEESELSCLRVALQRRSNREPAAYISEEVEFAGLTLRVTPSVLIPRPETEILVEKIFQKLKSLPLKNKILWDVCCGSGCIGLALKNRFPDLKIVFSDISEEALEIAKQNTSCISSNNLKNENFGGTEISELPKYLFAPNSTASGYVDIEFKQGDLFAPFLSQKCDFFVCNPPYVTEKEYLTLEPEVRNEPKKALVAGVNGLEFYERIAKDLKYYLNPGGMAWLEIGTGQGSSVKYLFESEGWHCYYEPDWSGQDRFFFIENF